MEVNSTTSVSDVLNNWATFILALSIASERFVAIFKTIFPKFANDKTNSDGSTNLKADQGRRLTIQLVAFIGGWITAMFIGGDSTNSFNPNSILWVHVGNNLVFAPWLGFLASGGSALWAGVVQYTSAAKDVQTKMKAGMVPADQAKK
jgi:hypothetical protein